MSEEEGRVHCLCSRRVCRHYPWQALRAWRALPVGGESAFQALGKRRYLIPFDLEPVNSYGRLSLVIRHIGRVSPRRATDFFVVRQRSRQENVPRCRAPFGGALFPGPSGGVCANSPCGLKHAQPFSRLPNPPVGATEGTGNAGDQRPVPDSISVGTRSIRKARSDPAGSRAGESFAQQMTGGRRRGFAEHALRRRSRPGVQTRPWKNPGQPHATHWKAGQQGLYPRRSNEPAMITSGM